MGVEWIAITVAMAIGVIFLLGIARIVQLRQRFARESIIRLAYAGSCFGVDSGTDSVKSWSGAGIFVLTTASIQFKRYVGNGSLDIPLSTLIGIDEAHTFKAMVSLSRLLIITYREADGSLSAAAFTNVDCAAWMEAIQRQRQAILL